MEPTDAADTIGEQAEEEEQTRADHDRFRKRAAIVIGIMAMMLAISGVGGGNATKETIDANIQASDAYAFYQAKNIRQTANVLAADNFDVILATQRDLPPQTRADIQKKIDGYRQTATRYESEPTTGDGKKELLAKAQTFETKRNRAQQQDPNFDYAQAFYQIAIVIASVSILSDSRRLLLLSLALGVLATVLMLNGFLLFTPLPLG